MNNAALQEKYDRIYAEGPAKFHTLTTEDVTTEVLKELDWTGKTVLEVGCGEGHTALNIAKAGAECVLAYDYSGNAIKQARRNRQESDIDNVSFHCRGGPGSGYYGHFDVVVAQEILEHTDKPIESLGHWKQFLKPEGDMIVTCPSFLNPRGYVWMALAMLLDVPMSLTDLHFITPWQMKRWAYALGMEITWRTFRHDLGMGAQLLRKDMEKRLHNALRDVGLQHDKDKIGAFLDWLVMSTSYIVNDKCNGAGALYHLRFK